MTKTNGNKSGAGCGNHSEPAELKLIIVNSEEKADSRPEIGLESAVTTQLLCMLTLQHELINFLTETAVLRDSPDMGEQVLTIDL